MPAVMQEPLNIGQNPSRVNAHLCHTVAKTTRLSTSKLKSYIDAFMILCMCQLGTMEVVIKLCDSTGEAVSQIVKRVDPAL